MRKGLTLMAALVLLATMAIGANASAQRNVSSTIEKEKDGIVRLYPFPDNKWDWGYMDEKGNVIIKPKYDYAFGFYDGRARVVLDDKYGYIDETGEVVIPIKYDDATNFGSGNAVVKYMDAAASDKSGYNIYTTLWIRPNGKYFLKLSTAWAHPFKDELTGVLIDNGSDGEIVFVNKKGKIIINNGCDGIRNFNEGLAAVRSNDKWGFIDKAGKLVIGQKYNDVGGFSNGLAPVEVNGKWGFIDKSGKVIIPLQYQDARNFSEGIAAVMKDWKWGFIDINNQIVIKPQFTSAANAGVGDCINGLISVWDEDDNLKYYVDKTGNKIVPKI